MCILYVVQRLVLMRLLVLKELVPSMGLVNALGLIGEEDGVTVEGDTQLSLRHFCHLLLGEHGGCCYAWMNCWKVSCVSVYVTKHAAGTQTFASLSWCYSFTVICRFCLLALTFLQCFSNLDGVSRQVKVGVVGLQVANGAVSPCHAEALDEQLCREEGEKVQWAADVHKTEDVQETKVKHKQKDHQEDCNIWRSTILTLSKKDQDRGGITNIQSWAIKYWLSEPRATWKESPWDLDSGSADSSTWLYHINRPWVWVCQASSRSQNPRFSIPTTYAQGSYCGEWTMNKILPNPLSAPVHPQG